MSFLSTFSHHFFRLIWQTYFVLINMHYHVLCIDFYCWTYIKSFYWIFYSVSKYWNFKYMSRLIGLLFRRAIKLGFQISTGKKNRKESFPFFLGLEDSFLFKHIHLCLCQLLGRYQKAPNLGDRSFPICTKLSEKL